MIFEPKGGPSSDRKLDSHVVPEMTAGGAAIIGLMTRYLNGLLDPFVSPLEVHKLMYFMQEADEPLRLQFQKGKYGPYAENLRHVLNAIEGHFICGYADGGDFPEKQLELVPGAIEDAEHFLNHHPATQERFNRVAKLVEGFESSFGLELLSTTHWVLKHEPVRSVDEVIDNVYAWNEGKRQFTKRQIGLAVDVLEKHHWAKIAPA